MERSLTLLVLAMLSLGFVARPGAHGPRARPVDRPSPAAPAGTRRSRIRLIQALQDRSALELDASCSPNDFEVWSAERVRCDVEAGLAARRPSPAAQPSRVRDLTVREFGDTAVVSFLLQGEGAQASSPALFVVDVWTQSTSRLAVRYVSVPARPVPDDHRRE